MSIRIALPIVREPRCRVALRGQVVACAAGLLIGAGARPSPAQARPALGAIDAVVTDTSLAPMRASFVLERVATELDPVVVAANRAPTRMSEFEERRKRGEGQFMTEAEIEKLNVVGASDLLRTFMSVAFATTDGIVVNRRSLPIRTCPFQFFIDGVAIPIPRWIDMELPSPKELGGIEVYANSATVPLQYKTFGGSRGYSGGGGFCGVILLWTRGGA